MKFVLACYGTRGDVEPCAAIGRELLRRGHDVRMAVPPDLVDFVESVGLAVVAFGPDARTWQDLHRDFLTHLFRNPWKIPDLIRLGREDWELFTQCWQDISTTLTSAGGPGRPATHPPDWRAARCQRRGVLRHSAGHAAYQSRYRANGQTVPILPRALARSVATTSEWLDWPMTKQARQHTAP